MDGKDSQCQGVPEELAHTIDMDSETRKTLRETNFKTFGVRNLLFSAPNKILFGALNTQKALNPQKP